MDSDSRTADTERRRATVLFADIAGFTRLVEKSDAEHAYEVVTGCLKVLDTCARKHGGSVDKYLGDCIMAVFGVPLAIEDAPRAAINAAIEMFDGVREYNRAHRLASPLDIHIGINTGLAISGDVSGPVTREFAIMGDPVNVASRLKDLAPPGSIYVGAETHRSARSAFEFRTIREQSLKGRSQSESVYEVLSRQTHLFRPSHPTDTTALVGRASELERLADELQHAKTGQGRVVALIGEAGLGKSRLLAELEGRKELQGMRLLRGRSLSTGSKQGFHPLVDLCRMWAKAEGADEAAFRGAVTTALSDQLRSSADEVRPFLLSMLGLALQGRDVQRLEQIEAESHERMTLRSVRTWLEQLAKHQPLLLAFEDLHWADHSSLKLLEGLLVAKLPGVSFLLIFRPGFAETSEALRMAARSSPSYSEIELGPLSSQESEALLDKIWKAGALPANAARKIVERTAGNPFYLEEVLRSLDERGSLEEIDLPGTVQEVIMSRVDRASGTERRLLQAASVIGLYFNEELLEHLLGGGSDLESALAGLVDKALITPTCEGAKQDYTFKHPLVAEVVYDSMTRDQRRGLHHEVAKALETNCEPTVSGFYAQMAYHLTRAGDTERSEQYLSKAGEEAIRSAASAEALQYFQAAAEAYASVHGDSGDYEKKAELEHNIGLAHFRAGNLIESVQHFDQALIWLGDRVSQGGLSARLSFAANLVPLLLQLSRQMRKPRYRKMDPKLRKIAEIRFARARAQTTSDAERLFLEMGHNLRLLIRTDPKEVPQIAGIYGAAGAAFAFAGLSNRIGAMLLRHAKTLVRDENPKDRFSYYTNQHVYDFMAGRWNAVEPATPDMLKEAIRLGQFWEVNTYLGLECERRFMRGEFDEAETHLEALAELKNMYGYEFAWTNYLGEKGFLELQRRDLSEARRFLDEYCQRPLDVPLQVLGLAKLAHTQVLQGESAAAEKTLARVKGILDGQGFVPPYHIGAYYIAELTLARVRPRKALRNCIKAALAHAKKFPRDRAEIYRLVSLLEAKRGRSKRAERYFAEGLIAARFLGFRVECWEDRKSVE